MEKLGNGMSINATAYNGERHVCTKIDQFQNGMARITQLSANSDSTGENVNLKKNHLLNRGRFLAPYDIFDKRYVPHRVTFPTVRPKSHVGAKYSHG